MDWTKKGAIGAGIGAGVSAYIDITLKMKELALAEQKAKTTEEYQNKILEEQKNIRIATQETRKRNDEIAKIEQVVKLLNAAGGVTMPEDQAKEFSESYGMPKEFFRKELDKDGKPTENMVLHDPDSQANMIKMMKFGMDQMQQTLNAYATVLNLEKFRLFKETPAKTITTEEGIMGIYPGGRTEKLGERPPPQISAGERMTIAKEEAGIEALNRIEKMFNEDYVGPITGRMGQVKDIWGGNPQAQSEFYAAIATLTNSTIKLITGAQMSFKEEARIKKEIPSITNPPSVFKARLKQTRINRKMMLEKIKEQAGKQPAVSKDISTMSIEDLEEIIRQGE